MTETQDEPVQLTNAYDGTQIKFTLDDEIKRYFDNEAKFTTNHHHDDIKLVLGYLSCFFAGGSFLYEYKFGFEAAKTWTLVGVVSFTFLQALLWIYTIFVEKKEIFVGTRKKADKTKAEKLVVSSSMEKYSPNYELTLDYTDKQTAKHVKKTVQKNVSGWFTQEGELCQALVDQDLHLWLEDAIRTQHTD